tara:strand:- start:192 stop:434 length:243 start_codon:yes stop_codon:yes gene_type:complete
MNNNTEQQFRITLTALDLQNILITTTHNLYDRIYNSYRYNEDRQDRIDVIRKIEAKLLKVAPYIVELNRKHNPWLVEILK